MSEALKKGTEVDPYQLRLEGFICEVVQGIIKTFAERGVDVDVFDGLKLYSNLSEAVSCEHTEFNVVGDFCLEAEEILDQT